MLIAQPSPKCTYDGDLVTYIHTYYNNPIIHVEYLAVPLMCYLTTVFRLHGWAQTAFHDDARNCRQKDGKELAPPPHSQSKTYTYVLLYTTTRAPNTTQPHIPPPPPRTVSSSPLMLLPALFVHTRYNTTVYITTTTTSTSTSLSSCVCTTCYVLLLLLHCTISQGYVVEEEEVSSRT